MLELFATLSLFFVPLVALLAFMVWDRKRMERPGTGKTSTPEERSRVDVKQTRKLLAGLSLVAATMGVFAWMNPKAPPFSGRWGWLEALAYSQFGQSGTSWIWFAASAVLLAAAYFGRE